jgi:hypothetical protein
MSTAFHPETDGQSKVVNKTIAMYLRCLTGDRPRAWVELLPWAEYCYNTSYHSALQTTPFRVVYGREPPALLPYQPGTASRQAVDDMLQECDLFLAEVRDKLLQAQKHARRFYDGRHRDLEFSVDDWIWLRLLNRQAVFDQQTQRKVRSTLRWPFPCHGTRQRRISFGASTWSSHP